MKNHCIPALLLAVFFLLAIPLLPSCDKDEDPPEPICLISSLNTSFEVICNGDTIAGDQVIHITYDEQDRPIRWDEGEGYYALFVYDNDGRLERTKEFFGEYEDHLVFTWDGQWVTKQWYWDEGNTPSSYKNRIQFNEDQQIVRVEGYRREEGQYILSWYDLHIWENGNIVRVEDYGPDDPDKNATDRRSLFTTGGFNKPWERQRDDAPLPQAPVSSKSTDFVLQGTTNFTYDNKRNPFSLHPAWHLWGLWEMHYHSKNNILSWVWASQGDGEEWVMNQAYEYNAQNYPTQVVKNMFDFDGCDFMERIEIHYVNCD